jgi:hypothetical protein
MRLQGYSTSEHRDPLDSLPSSRCHFCALAAACRPHKWHLDCLFHPGAFPVIGRYRREWQTFL